MFHIVSSDPITLASSDDAFCIVCWCNSASSVGESSYRLTTHSCIVWRCVFVSSDGRIVWWSMFVSSVGALLHRLWMCSRIVWWYISVSSDGTFLPIVWCCVFASSGMHFYIVWRYSFVSILVLFRLIPELRLMPKFRLILELFRLTPRSVWRQSFVWCFRLTVSLISSIIGQSKLKTFLYNSSVAWASNFT